MTSLSDSRTFVFDVRAVFHGHASGKPLSGVGIHRSILITAILTRVRRAEDSPPLCRPELQKSCAGSSLSGANDLSSRRWWLPTKTEGVLQDQERAQDIGGARVMIMAGNIPDGQVERDGKT